MKISETLNRYLAGLYVRNLLFMLGILLGIVYLFDTIELLRRAGKKSIPLSTVLEMGLLKLPDVGQMILPFAILFSAMFTFWQLNRRSELIVLRAGGFSVWQFLAPVFSVAVLGGFFYLAVVNPIGAAMLGKYESMEDRLILHRTSSVTLSKQGLWLLQERPDGQVIIHADRVDLPDWTLHKVMVLYFDPEDMFQRRLDSATARLDDGQWLFKDVTSNQPGAKAEQISLISMQTDLTRDEIEETFASPSTVSFWQLPSYIQTMEDTGFDSTRLRIYFHTLLAQPLLFFAMVLLAAVVSLKPPRFQGTFMMIVMGIVAGFAVFFAASFLQALGTSHQIPVLAAAWAPALVAALIGAAIMLNMEDG